jgi:hypothetical protein
MTNAFDPMRPQLKGTMLWSARLLGQSCHAASLISMPPLITGLAGDPIIATDGGESRMVQGNLLTKLGLLFRR